MKICYVNPTFLIRRPISDLIGQLGDEHDIGLLVPRKPFNKVDSSWHSNEQLKKAKIYDFPAINLPFLNFEWPIPISPRFFVNLIKIFRKYEVVHLWTYFYLSSLFVILTKIFFPRKKLIMSCDTFPGYSFKSGLIIDALFKIYTIIFKKLLFGIPNNIHLYGNSIKGCVKRFNINKNKIVILPTGINLKKFRDIKGDLKEKLGFKNDDIILVYAGLMVPRKGIDIMIETINKIKYKNVKLLLVGEGPSKRKYQKLVKRKGLKKKVTFEGWRKDIPNVLKSSDILFLPSRGEGMPGIIMEAMASKIPVVASDIPCISDLIKNKKSGYLCKMKDVDCFVKMITSLIKEKGKNKKFIDVGFEYIKRFQWEKLVPKYLEMYGKK